MPKLGCTRESLGGFLEMLASGVHPDGMVISYVLSVLPIPLGFVKVRHFMGLLLKEIMM